MVLVPEADQRDLDLLEESFKHDAWHQEDLFEPSVVHLGSLEECFSQRILLQDRPFAASAFLENSSIAMHGLGLHAEVMGHN